MEGIAQLAGAINGILVLVTTILGVLVVVLPFLGKRKLAKRLTPLREGLLNYRGLVEDLTEVIEEHAKDKADVEVKARVAAKVPESTTRGQVLNHVLEKAGKRKPRQNFVPRKRSRI